MVLSNGGVVSLEGWHHDVEVIVEAFLLGQAGGGAIADVLFGVVNPSRHLAETIPRRLEGNPSWLNFPGEQGHVRYGEGMFVGYRYYTTAGVPVRYPFGHGLSYTTFDTTDLTVANTAADAATRTASGHQHRAGSRKTRRADVRLHGCRSRAPATARTARIQQDRAASGRDSRGRIDLDRRAFAYWDIELDRWVVLLCSITDTTRTSRSPGGIKSFTAERVFAADTGAHIFA